MKKGLSIIPKFWRKIFSLLFLLLPLSVLAVSSTSYEIDPSGLDVIHHETNSTSYQIEGSLEAITAEVTSTSYEIESGSSFAGYCGDGFIDPSEDCEGSDLNSEDCDSQGFDSGTLACDSSCAFDTSSCSTDTGGGGEPIIRGTAPNTPTFDSSILSKTFTYLSELPFFGTKATNAAYVLVNDSADDVTYATASRWQKTLSLSLGSNTITIEAGNAVGLSGSTSHTINRRTVGDANNNGAIDDYDFSLLANHWNEDWAEADFNEDGVVDDFDISLMASYWTQ